MNREGAPRLDLVTDPERILIPEEDSRPPIAAFVVIGAGALIAFGLAFVASDRGDDGSAARRQPVLDGAPKMLGHITQREQRSVAAHVRVIADDGRIRTTLATPGMDAATIEDLMRDFQRASGLEVVGLLDAKGLVRAVVGKDELRGVDLSSSSLFAQRADPAPSRLWTFKGKLMVVALAAVKLGYEELYLLGASEVGTELLSPLYEAFGVAAGLVLDGELRASTGGETPDAKAVALAAKSSEERSEITVDGQRYEVRRQTLGDLQPPALVVWVRATETSTSPGASWALWMSALLLLATSALACFLTWRAR